MAVAVLGYCLPYISYRNAHVQLWEADHHVYVIYPAGNTLAYRIHRPLMYIDGALTGMRFHLGPHPDGSGIVRSPSSDAIAGGSISDAQAIFEGAGIAQNYDTRAIPETARRYLGRRFYIRDGSDNIEYVIDRIEPYGNDAHTEFPSLLPRVSSLINNRVTMYYRPVVFNRNRDHRGGRTISMADLKGNIDTAALSKLFRSGENYSLDEIMAMATRERCGPSKSIDDARNRGVLVLVLSSDTTDIAYGGDQARLAEIWLESCSNRTPQWSDAGNSVPHYHLCFATNKPASHYRRLFPCFKLRGSRKCFGVSHSGDIAVFISPSLSSPPTLPASVISSDFQRNVVFTLSSSGQAR